MTVVIHDGLRAVPGDVRALWISLVEAKGYNPSLHPDWLEATLTAWGLSESTAVAVVRGDSDSVAIIPFLVRRATVLGLPLRYLDLASNVVSYHAEIVSSGDLTPALMEFFADRRLPRWDAFRAANLVIDGSTAPALRAVNSQAFSRLSTLAGERSPYIAIQHDWTAFLATRAKKLRANITRSERQMRAAGETGMGWYEADSDTRKLLQEMLEIEARSWKAAEGVAIVAGTPQCAYYERLLPWLAANGALLANVLYVAQRPVAYTLCASWRGWVGQLKTSFVQELRDAGSRVFHSSIERAFENRAREYDFLGDAAPHKLRWADQTRDHEELWGYARHVRARALGGIKATAGRWRRRDAPQASEPTAASAE